MTCASNIGLLYISARVISLYHLLQHVTGGMTEHTVHEWLVDYSALSPVEVHSFASSLEHNQEVVAALYTVLEERNKYQEVR